MAKSKKGQGSLEFLMTYGWGILAVIITIGSLAYFGIIDGDLFVPRICTLVPGIHCEEVQIYQARTYAGDWGSNIIFIVLRNSLGENMNNVLLTVKFKEQDCKPKGQSEGAQPTSITNGATAEFKYYCSPALEIGTKVKGTLTLDYSIATGTLMHRATGELTHEIEFLQIV